MNTELSQLGKGTFGLMISVIIFWKVPIFVMESNNIFNFIICSNFSFNPREYRFNLWSTNAKELFVSFGLQPSKASEEVNKSKIKWKSFKLEDHSFWDASNHQAIFRNCYLKMNPTKQTDTFSAKLLLSNKIKLFIF